MIDTPSLEKLKKAPASPHVDPTKSYKGWVKKTEEGLWLTGFETWHYAWIGKDAAVKKISFSEYMKDLKL